VAVVAPPIRIVERPAAARGMVVWYVISLVLCTIGVWFVLEYEMTEIHLRRHTADNAAAQVAPAAADAAPTTDTGQVRQFLRVSLAELDSELFGLIWFPSLLYFLFLHHLIGWLVVMGFFKLHDANDGTWGLVGDEDFTFANPNVRLLMMSAWPLVLVVTLALLVFFLIGAVMRLATKRAQA
jgi:hypothetical protein